MRIIAQPSKGRLTNHGKRYIAKSMYFKGCDFIYAALLLKKEKNQQGHVYLHLICQGLEIIYKSALLLKDYDKFKEDIRKKIRHDLIKLIDCWSSECNRNRINKIYYREVSDLNEFYKRHHLRYGNLTDIFLNPNQFRTTWTTRHLMKLMVTMDKEVMK